jgi:transcription factor TFIIIB component B''
MIVISDVQTLSRMTGKDFSGPTPVIRAVAPLTLAESDNPSETKR